MAERRKLISLCMIVKNEERNIVRCLRSAEGAVDEMIVVDTGSSDGTAAVARECGARVIEAAWTGDFAAARNIGVKEASGEWILILDADEELAAGAAAELRPLAAHTPASGILLPIWNMLGGEDDGATINPVLRMFRNDPLHRFEGRIHEQIAVSIMRANPTAQLCLGETVIRHYGYRPSVVAEKDKMRRNTELLLRSIEEEPDNPFHRYNLGVEHLRAGQSAAALDSFREAKKADGFAKLSYAHLVYKYEVRSLQSLRRWQEAVLAAEEGIRLFGDYADLWHTLAESLARSGKLRRAASAAAAAIRLGRPQGVYHTEDGMGSHQTAFLLGVIYEWNGSIDAAAHWYIESVSMKPSLLPPLLRLCRMMRVCGRSGELPALLARRFTAVKEEAGLKIAAVLLDSGCYAEAVRWLRQRAAEPAWGAASAAWLGLAEAECAAAEGRFAVALRWVERGLEQAAGEGKGKGKGEGEGGCDRGNDRDSGSHKGGAQCGDGEAGDKRAGRECVEEGPYSASVARRRMRDLQAALSYVEAGGGEEHPLGGNLGGQELLAGVSSERLERTEPACGLLAVAEGAAVAIPPDEDGFVLERVVQAALRGIADGGDEAARGGIAALTVYADSRLRLAESLLDNRHGSPKTAHGVVRSARLILAGCERGE
ncbi:tetratricopeptide repeat-containing glycosyltransferase family 2 protein [Paenibacillus kobensis]|uniref:tetratricopeptide repeat-containing glycosyltransferase family 2 protein n=1 Tax=Paenibacillus kobensis TaxID=59841 RepID=UPI0013E38A3B|nr:glycosyltransferase [Paenibacillus kobensis]